MNFDDENFDENLLVPEIKNNEEENQEISLRPKKLMLHKYEINKLIGKLNEKGLTLVPLRVYFKGSLVKVEIGLARGKKLYDKRDDIRKRDLKREHERDYKIKMR